MKVIENIHIKFDREKLLKQLYLEPGTSEAIEFTVLLSRASAVANPKAIYKEATIATLGDCQVMVNDVVFTSEELCANVQDTERAFLFITTSGMELEKLEIDEDNFLYEYWLDVIKAEAQRRMTGYLRNYLQRTYAIKELSSMCPGTGDPAQWDIVEQKLLFSQLPEAGEIGVTLSDKYLMTPSKSLSGLFFPGEWHYKDCHNCPRRHCPEREM